MKKNPPNIPKHNIAADIGQIILKILAARQA
jgi:hypothetical protein